MMSVWHAKKGDQLFFCGHGFTMDHSAFSLLHDLKYDCLVMLQFVNEHLGLDRGFNIIALIVGQCRYSSLHLSNHLGGQLQ